MVGSTTNIHQYSISKFLPSGKLLHSYGKSPFFMGKSTISMAIFNSYVKLPEGTTELHGSTMVPPWFHRAFRTRNSTYPDGRPITDEEIVGFLIAAFFGGALEAA